jgi:hypothetical protein
MKEFDDVIIWAGQAGPSLAGRLTGAVSYAQEDTKVQEFQP